MPIDVLFDSGTTSVRVEKRGRTSLVRIAGPCTPELVGWMRGDRIAGPAALLLRNLAEVDGSLADAVKRRKPAFTLIDAPAPVLDALGPKWPVLSCEAAIVESGSIPESLDRERDALQDLASRYRANPLWRKADHEGDWLCPFCAKLTGLRPADPLTPPVLRAMRAHILEQCSGRRSPLPASVLDAFLADVNRAKGETKTRKLESLVELERSADEAKKRQRHLLPIQPPPDAVAEIEVVYRPLQSVGGDFLDFYSLADDRFGVAIGDVSGHGIEAAIVMGMAKMALKIGMGVSGPFPQILAEVNKDLSNELRRAAFVTAFVATIDRPTRRMTYARLGHPPALLRRGAEILELDGPGLPFGVDAGPRFPNTLQVRETELRPGDLVLLYTDGVTEALAEEQFGDERLKEALKTAPPEAVLPHLTAALDAFLGPRPVGDDVTLVALHIR